MEPDFLVSILWFCEQQGAFHMPARVMRGRERDRERRAAAGFALSVILI